MIRCLSEKDSWRVSLRRARKVGKKFLEPPTGVPPELRRKTTPLEPPSFESIRSFVGLDDGLYPTHDVVDARGCGGRGCKTHEFGNSGG